MKSYKIMIVMMLFFCLLITNCTQPIATETTLSKTETKTEAAKPVPTKTLQPSATSVPTQTDATATLTPSATLEQKVDPVTIPACVEGEIDDTTGFYEILWVTTQNLYEMDSYRYRTLYRYLDGDDYAEDELSVDVTGIHQNRLGSPEPNFYYPMSTQRYERSYVTLVDLSTQSQMQTIITEQGYWLRIDDQWMAFDAATSADMLNLADMFSPLSMFSNQYQGGFIMFLIGEDPGLPTNLQVETIDGKEVRHRCWILPDFGEGGNAIIYHYEDYYTYFDISEVHLWTAQNDTQLVQVILSGNHIGERMGYGAEAVIYDPPQDFLLWMEISPLDDQVDITPPSSDEIIVSVISEPDSIETIAAPYNELPIPNDAVSMGAFDGETWYSGLAREFTLPVGEGQYWMMTNYLGGGWDEIPVERRPMYETQLNPSEATAFYLQEMSRRGWQLQDHYLLFGLPELYLFFERNGVVLPVMLAPQPSGGTRISAILPPPTDETVAAVLSGWVSFKPQNYYQYDDRITAIAFDSQEHIWIGTGAGLKVFDGQAWTTYTAADLDLPSEETGFEVLALAVDQQGRVWVGTHEGLSVFDGRTWKTYTPQNSELAGTPWAISVDGSGNIWMGHGYGSSVSAFDGTAFQNYTEEDIGMPGGHAVDIITTDQQGRIWIGTSGGGVYMFDGFSWNTAVDAKSGANTTDVMTAIEDLEIDHQGRVWVGSGQGLGVFEAGNWTIYTTENSDLADNWVNSLEVDPEGHIWVMTTGGRLNRIDTSGEWTDYTPLNPDISIRSPESLAIDPQGRVWVGLDYGGISVFAPPGTTLIAGESPALTPTTSPKPTASPSPTQTTTPKQAPLQRQHKRLSQTVRLSGRMILRMAIRKGGKKAGQHRVFHFLFTMACCHLGIGEGRLSTSVRWPQEPGVSMFSYLTMRMIGEVSDSSRWN